VLQGGRRGELGFLPEGGEKKKAAGCRTGKRKDVSLVWTRRAPESSRHAADNRRRSATIGKRKKRSLLPQKEKSFRQDWAEAVQQPLLEGGGRRFSSQEGKRLSVDKAHPPSLAGGGKGGGFVQKIRGGLRLAPNLVPKPKEEGSVLRRCSKERKKGYHLL